jgi:hypothetical protein
MGKRTRSSPAWLADERARTALVALWALVVQSAFLVSDPLFRSPVSLLFVGDGPAFLQEAWRIAQGAPREIGNLPFHPPLASWILVPLWKLFGEPAAASAAAKLLMAALAAATYALLYRLIRARIPHALPIALLLPLSAGELFLVSAASNEVPYRLLLVALLALGFRWPLLAGALHGLAALTRPEHLVFALLLGVGLALFAPERRRYAAVAALAMALVLAPHTLLLGRTLARYNAEHAQQLPAPLPVVVPVSFYGPLNFALAQREEELHFARRTLPPAPAGPAILDPTFPPHHEVIVSGYALGLAEIRDRPGRFLARSAAKVGHSLRALTFGWTGRDLPAGGRWLRQPVDVAHAGTRSGRRSVSPASRTGSGLCAGSARCSRWGWRYWCIASGSTRSSSLTCAACWWWRRSRSR